jgi:hypothetical protein
LLGAGREPTRLAPLAGPFLRAIQNKAERRLPSFLPKAVHLPITTGAIFIFWSWLCLAFADVGAYFVGKNFGKTKLSKISPAAGATSPNKTVEGVVGGCVVSAMLGMLGKCLYGRGNVCACVCVCVYRRTGREEATISRRPQTHTCYWVVQERGYRNGRTGALPVPFTELISPYWDCSVI